MFSEDDLLPISALQHLLFCERQCALIHIERLWVENRLTAQGRHMHEKAHGEGAGPRGGGLAESRPGVRIARALRLRSLRLGLFGVADVVEFRAVSNQPSAFGEENDRRDSRSEDAGGTPAPQTSDRQDACPTVPFPVEYKRGRPKVGDYDRVQLCAQAICLEEMLGVEVPVGALFYGRTRRRQEVKFDAELRGRTEAAAIRLHELIASGRTPVARREPKCEHCSLLPLCMPDATGAKKSAMRYVQRALAGIGEGTPDGE